MPIIEYFYSARSVYAYLGAAELNRIAARHGRRIVHKVIDLSVTIPATGGRWFDDWTPERKAYFFGVELDRWASHRNLRCLRDPVHHVGDRTLPSGTLLAAQRLGGGDVDAFSEMLLAALWRDDRDVADRDVLAGLLTAAGFVAGPVLDLALDPEVQAEFAANSAEAIRRNVFGSPTYIVDGEPFYGQDRLEFVARKLARA